MLFLTSPSSNFNHILLWYSGRVTDIFSTYVTILDLTECVPLSILVDLQSAFLVLCLPF